ncbi:hypothetical protein [Streptomyces decoyicus]|uniref:hypothetical protein n=1 Tax=Streptomyces decoyicus TaxID=249567 RepID=UPI003663EB24
MILATRLPWHVQFSETPRPRAAAAIGVDVVVTALRVGMSALEALRFEGEPVGPALCCLAHGSMFIPVEAGTIHRWGAAHSQCLHDSWTCAAACESGWSRCPRRFWLLPHETSFPTTSPDGLHHQLGATRAQLRMVAA